MSSSLSVRPSACPSVSAWFPLSNFKRFGFYSNFAYTCISGASAFGLLVGKILEIFDSYLPATHLGPVVQS